MSQEVNCPNCGGPVFVVGANFQWGNERFESRLYTDGFDTPDSPTGDKNCSSEGELLQCRGCNAFFGLDVNEHGEHCVV